MRLLAKGKRTLVWARDASLPERCISCGSLRVVRARPLELRWVSPWVVVGLPFGIFPAFLLAALLNKSSAHRYTQCAGCAAAWDRTTKRRTWATVAGFLAMPAGVALTEWAESDISPLYVLGLMAFIGGPTLAAFAWLFVAWRRPRAVWINAHDVCLKNVSPELRRGVPEAPPPLEPELDPALTYEALVGKAYGAGGALRSLYLGNGA